MFTNINNGSTNAMNLHSSNPMMARNQRCEDNQNCLSQSQQINLMNQTKLLGKMDTPVIQGQPNVPVPRVTTRYLWGNR